MMNVSRAVVFVMEDQLFLLLKKNIICTERGRKKCFPLTEKKVYFQVFLLLISSFSCAYIIYIS